ncbi:MAG: MBL fold metallo-hydrolase [Dehalococcoidia bacterium]
MQVSAHVRAVQVPDEHPMHPQFTNMYVVSGERSMVIDSGEAMDRYRWMLRGYLAATGTEVSLLAITHHHFDHTGNLQWANEQLHCPVALPAASLKLLKGKLPKDAAQLRIIEDGEVIDLGAGVRLWVLSTPGHTVDSVCYYLESEGVLFTGDTMLGGSTTTVSDLDAYLRSMRMLADLPGLQTICPGHGPVLQDARKRLLDVVAHREGRDRQILDALSDGEPLAAWDIMLRVYPGLDERLRRAATGNVVTHLKAMRARGELREVAGKPKKPNAAKQAKAAQKAKERAALIKAAEKAREDERKERLRAQAQPPDDQWLVPPKFARR